MQIGAATMENTMGFPKKIKNETALWPSDSTSGYISEKLQNTNSKESMHLMFIAALFTIAKIWKQPKCPTIDEWVKKLWYIYTMEYYLAVLKKQEILPFATTWMDLESIMLREISQPEKDKHPMISLLCGI